MAWWFTNNKASRRQSASWLFTRLAFQNLLRRPARTALLLLAVALATGALFASVISGRGIQTSMERGFSRMGADLVVVPEEAMVNITSAQLTVQPTEATFDADLVDEIAGLRGVARVAPQTIYKVPTMAGMPEHKANLIAFDPQRDFTVLPWVESALQRPLQVTDLIVGARRSESAGDEIELCNRGMTVFAKLGRSGVGPFDESMFASYETVAQLLGDGSEPKEAIPGFRPGKVSAVLVRLSMGATPEQVRFAIARIKGVKVITGATIVTSTRQATTALLAGMLGFAALMLAGSLILVGLLFAAIISERRRELGLLGAIGTRRGDIVKMLLTEAAFATSLGGLCGLLFGSGLLLFFQNSLVYYLQTMHIAFSWPPSPEIALTALVCAGLAALLGVAGALLPACTAGAEDPYTLIHGEAS